MKKYAAVFLLVTVAVTAYATGLKTWTTRETVSATDLNANFAYVDSRAGHTGAAAIVNADISASAAIATSKLATPTLMPKAWATSYDGLAPRDSDGLCTIVGSKVTSITRHTQGIYDVVLAYTPVNDKFAILVTCYTNGQKLYGSHSAISLSPPQFAIICYNEGGAAEDTHVSFIIMDDN